MVFSTVTEYIEAMGAKVRRSDLKMGAIAKQSEVIKSPTTVSKLAHGETHFPRFQTMFGVAAALGVEVVLRPRPRKK